jgi:hypothetical protein
MRGIIHLLTSLSVLLYLASSCDNVRQVRIPQITEKEAREVECNLPIHDPVCFFNTSNRLVIYQDKTEYPLLIFPLPFNGNDGYYDCTRGRGPGEFTFPDGRSFEAYNNGFSFFEQGGLEKVYELDSSGHFTCIRTEQHDFRGGVLNGVKRLSTGLLNVNTDTDSDFEFSILKPDHQIEYVSKYPDIDIEANEFKPIRFIKSITVHPDRNVFASFYAFDPIVRLCSAKGNIITEITLPVNGTKNSVTGKTVYFWGGVWSNDNLILAKYGDCSFLLLDWKGKVLKNIIIDSPITLFTYVFATDTLYAIDTTPEDGPRLIYCDHFLN